MRRCKRENEQIKKQLIVLLNDKWLEKEIHFVHKGKVTVEKVKSANIDENGLYFTTNITEMKFVYGVRFDVPVRIYEYELIEL